jgi:tetratricopeptide (TPR) repeat protein
VLLLLTWTRWAPAEQSPLEQARAFLAAGDRDQAIPVLRKLVAAEPQNADGRLMLGTVLALEGVLGESIEQLRESVRLRPDWAPAHNTLGMALSRFGQIAMARASFEEAVRLDPNLAQAQINLALILAQGGELDAAMTHLDGAVATLADQPQGAYPRMLRARIWTQQNRPEKAAEELEAAIKLRPDYAEAWVQLGKARRSLLNNPGAVEAFEKAVALDPEDAEALYHLGALQLQAGRVQQAIEHLRVAARLRPDDRPTLYNLMRALQKDGQREEAERVNVRLQGLLKERSDSEKGSLAALELNNDAVKLQKTGDVRAALDKYRAAIELHPTHAGFHLNYGLALCEAKQWDECVGEIKESLQLEPGDPKATQALYVALEKKRAAAGK